MADPCERPAARNWVGSASACHEKRQWPRPADAAVAAAFLVAAALCFGLLSQGDVSLATRQVGAAGEFGQDLAAPAAGDERPGQRECRLDIGSSPLNEHCQRLERVCVDQGQLIFHDPRHQAADGREPAPLPRIAVERTRLHFWPWLLPPEAAGRSGGGGEEDGDEEEEAAGGGDNSEGAGRRRLGGRGENFAGGVRQGRRLAYDAKRPGQHFGARLLPAIPTRPATRQEPTPYLASPVFSTCTVPVVGYPLFARNFAHFFHDFASFMHALLRRTPWREHAKVLVMTADGLALTQPERQLLPALSNLSAASWADFTRRLPPDYEPQADRQQPPPSFEGGEQRCFQTLFVCGGRFKPANPLRDGVPKTAEEEAALLKRAVPRDNYAFGQAVVDYYTARRGSGTQQQGEKQQQKQEQQAGAVRRLRVRFMRRDSDGRQLLNAEELLRSCNAWRYRSPGGGPDFVTADCQQVEVNDLQSGIAAAQEADVFVGMHGANQANSYLMRPGSSTIEITPFEFGLVGGSFGPCTQNAQDATSQLLWWSLVTCDASLSQPGPDEAAGREPRRWWSRDRSSRVPWAVLATVLEEIVQLGGSRERYLRERFVPGTHRLHFTAAGVASRGDEPLCAGTQAAANAGSSTAAAAAARAAAAANNASPEGEGGSKQPI